jgi:hypothetical protein
MPSRRRKAAEQHAENVEWATEIKNRAHDTTTARGHAMTWRLEDQGTGYSPTWYGECDNCGATMSAFPGGTSAGGLGRVARDMDCTGPGTAWQGEMVAELQSERVNAAVGRFGQDVKDSADRDWLRSQGIEPDAAPPAPRGAQCRDERSDAMTAKYPGSGGFTDSSWTGRPSGPAPGYTGEDLVAAVHNLNYVARYGGILAKQQAIGVLEGVISGIHIAAQVLASDLRQAGYGPAVTDPVYVASTSLNNAAGQFEHAKTALAALLNTPVGELASSGQQVPNNTELNGSQ